MVERSEHFKQRFDERICSKTKRQQFFVERAYRFGCEAEAIKDARLRKFVRGCEHFSRVAKFYNGQVYIFDGKIAITVFPVPNKLRCLM